MCVNLKPLIITINSKVCILLLFRRGRAVHHGSFVWESLFVDSILSQITATDARCGNTKKMDLGLRF